MSGRILYVMGPSGAGKDTLIARVREALGGRGRTLFAHRYITRPPEPGGENHVWLLPAEMAQRAAMGLFLFAWESHGHRYGIGIEVRRWLAAPANVVVNGSRRHLREAMERAPDLVPILIEAPESVLRQRLLARGRESPEEIEARLAQARMGPGALPAHARRVRNDASVEAGTKALLAIVRTEEAMLPPGEPRGRI